MHPLNGIDTSTLVGKEKIPIQYKIWKLNKKIACANSIAQINGIKTEMKDIINNNIDRKLEFDQQIVSRIIIRAINILMEEANAKSKAIEKRKDVWSGLNSEKSCKDMVNILIKNKAISIEKITDKNRDENISKAYRQINEKLKLQKIRLSLNSEDEDILHKLDFLINFPHVLSA